MLMTENPLQLCNISMGFMISLQSSAVIHKSLCIFADCFAGSLSYSAHANRHATPLLSKLITMILFLKFTIILKFLCKYWVQAIFGVLDEQISTYFVC